MLSLIESVFNRVRDLSRRLVDIGVRAIPGGSASAISTADDALVRCADLKPAGAHWQAVADVLGDRVAAARLIAERQRSALNQLDAAEFALANIIEDLSAIMPLPSRRALNARQVAIGARNALAA